MRKVMITGANTGLGKECARQLALQAGVEKVYLACRNKDKAEVAKQELEASTGKMIFEITMMDVSNLDSVKQAVKSLNEPIDALVMNAGGLGGKDFLKKTPDGVSQIVASNLLGHVLLTNELLKQSKLTGVVLYAGSEAIRGVPKLGMKKPKLQSGSVDEFVSICEGSFFDASPDPMPAYASVKLLGALWMSSMARKHPDIRFVTVSPGHTSGTQIAEDMPTIKKFFFKNIGYKILPLFGLAHDLKTGCKRFVDGLNDERYISGVFYASKPSTLTGPLIDQGTIFEVLNNQIFQNNAGEAINKFIR